MARPVKQDDERAERHPPAPISRPAEEGLSPDRRPGSPASSEADFIAAGSLKAFQSSRRPCPHRPWPRFLELNRIGDGVSQLARAMNAEREFRGDWRDVEREVRRLLEKVAAAYGS